MTPRVWDPWRELDALRREVERAFGSATGGNGISWPRFRSAFLPGQAARAYPLMNLGEDTDNVYIEALAPGLDPEKIDISVLRNTLRVSGEKQPLSDDIKPESFHRSERSAGSFVRTFELPTEVDSGKVSAEYKNGILKIVLPKSAQAKPKQISVQVS